MPAEWEPHAATWLSWPYNLETWKGHLEGAERAFVSIIKALSPHETVHLLVPDDRVRARAEKMLKGTAIRSDSPVIHTIESGDVWIRDYGPIFIKDRKGAVAFTKWIYTAYGNKYEDLLPGNSVPDRMPLQSLERFDTGFVLEGGSIDVNGTGSLLTTESCLLSPDRNPGKTKMEIDRVLKSALGVTNVLWLLAGIQGDDTDGHVDTISRFVGPSTVVTEFERDPSDPNYSTLLENAERLQTMEDEQGNLLEVLHLPMPKPIFAGGRRMAASYANFYVANDIVLTPTFADPSDEEAIDVLQKCFPERDVIGIDCRDLIWGYGSIHCATQQQPA
jgi:agmatine deiminase